MNHYRIIGWAVFWTAAIAECASCTKPVPHEIRPAFYYWKASLDLDSLERSYLRKDTSTLLYLRFFDVGWDQKTAQPVPVAPLRFRGSLPERLAYVPVVFITNETLEKSTSNQMAPLADHILEKIRTMSASLANRYGSVQLDCDWTVSTRDRYFRLLDTLRARLRTAGRGLSVTLRLHQIKYARETGVPPADRGMLMMYNMGDWKSPATENSLYDPDLAARYLSGLQNYPLPLDVAFPVLRWTIVYRNGRFLTFLNGIAADSLRRQSFLSQLRDPNRFSVQTDTFALGCSLRQGDLLRSETCGFAALMKGRKMVLQKIPHDKLTLALFHLDDALLKHYSHAQIQEIFSAVQ